MELNVRKTLRKYEGIVVLHPDTSEEEVKNLFRKNQEIVKSFAGQVNHLDTWGKRKLANPIDRVRIGTYFHTTFSAQGEAVEELERTMRINERVLRFIHVRLDDRTSLKDHVDGYKELIKESVNRENEREAKFQAKKAAALAAKKAMKPMNKI